MTTKAKSEGRERFFDAASESRSAQAISFYDFSDSSASGGP
ncbi:hypothetical protein [Nocardia sp. CA-119907]